ncbi:O-antigen ligase family protein [Pragia fontium]|uniref:O-antigen ligase family protein n=1 Tax=Pragia fontium TaxID=82985 RepID=UPI00064AB9AD|nr:O-antigen ligase family protein [Pragia fontium]AKJ43549.1 hypothetical protein QQ39_17040 [Pragia fontium]
MSIGKIKNNLIILCITLVIISISTVLINEKISRISFFIACYVSILGILLDKGNYKSYIKSIPIFLLIFGLSKLIWFYLFRISYDVISEIDMYSGYLQSGKRIILCSILTAYLLLNLKNKNYNRKIFIFSLGVSFTLATFFSIYQIKIGIPRVSLYTVATAAAYMYSCLSLVLISSLMHSSIKKTFSYLAVVLIFLISLFIIFHTGTRAAIIIHPLIFFVILLVTNWNNKYKNIFLSSATILILAFLFIFNNIIIEKINQTTNEIEIYKQSQGNEMSSLGARFSMWNTGIHSFYQHPMGATMKQRHETIESYTEKENRDRSAKNFTYIHLHNEIIDTLSLQGILGAAALLLFYAAMLIRAVKQKNPMLLSVMLCLIIYGLTDVIFINRAMSLLFCLMILTAILLNKQNESDKQSS